MRRIILIAAGFAAAGFVAYVFFTGSRAGAPEAQATIGLSERPGQVRDRTAALPAAEASARVYGAAFEKLRQDPELAAAVASPEFQQAVQEAAELGTSLALGILLPKSADRTTCAAGIYRLANGDAIVGGWVASWDAALVEIRDARGTVLQTLELVPDPGSAEPTSFADLAQFKVGPLVSYSVVFLDVSGNLLCTRVVQLRPSIRNLGLDLAGVPPVLIDATGGTIRGGGSTTGGGVVTGQDGGNAP